MIQINKDFDLVLADFENLLKEICTQADIPSLKQFKLRYAENLYKKFIALFSIF